MELKDEVIKEMDGSMESIRKDIDKLVAKLKTMDDSHKIDTIVTTMITEKNGTVSFFNKREKEIALVVEASSKFLTSVATFAFMELLVATGEISKDVYMKIMYAISDATYFAINKTKKK